MRWMRTAILLSSCASLLAVQIGGWHAHGDAHSHLADPVRAHLHFHGLHGGVGHAPGADSAAAESRHGSDAGSAPVRVAEMSCGNCTLPELDIHLHAAPQLASPERDRYAGLGVVRPGIRYRAWGPPPRGPPLRNA